MVNDSHDIVGFFYGRRFTTGSQTSAISGSDKQYRQFILYRCKLARTDRFPKSIADIDYHLGWSYRGVHICGSNSKNNDDELVSRIDVHELLIRGAFYHGYLHPCVSSDIGT